MDRLIPRYIIDKNISAIPVEELMVIGRLLGMVNDYATVTVQNGYASKSVQMFRNVEKELLRRKAVASIDEVYAVPDCIIDYSDLTALSVNELELLFRMSPRRYEKRLAADQEVCTRFFETDIVNELNRRIPIDGCEHLKIDYCRIVNMLELENIGFILQLPIGINTKNTVVVCSEDTLATIISIYNSYQNLNERELLVKYVDKALEQLQKSCNIQSSAGLAAILLDLDWQGKVKCPLWVRSFLSDAITQWSFYPSVDSPKMVIPMLTMEMLNFDNSLGKRAKQIINSCYHNCINGEYSLDELYIAIVCCDYVSCFNARQIATSWNALCSENIDSLSSVQTCKLIEAAAEIEDSATIDNTIKHRLFILLEAQAKSGDPVACAFLDKISAKQCRTISLAM